MIKKFCERCTDLERSLELKIAAEREKSDRPQNAAKNGYQKKRATRFIIML